MSNRDGQGSKNRDCLETKPGRMLSLSMWCPIYGARCKTWSAVCLMVPHLQFSENGIARHRYAGD